MAFGRPTEYREDYVLQIEKYLEEYKDLGEVIPTIAGVARYLGIARPTVYAWADDPEKADFSYMISKVQTEQEIITLSNGLTGAFKPQVSTLVLSKHGYAAKTDHTSSDGSMATQRTNLDDFYADATDTKPES